MEIIYLIFTLICSAGAVLIYRMGVDDGQKHYDTSAELLCNPPPSRDLQGITYPQGTRQGKQLAERGTRGSLIKSTPTKELSPEDKKIKEGITNILNYGIGGE